MPVLIDCREADAFRDAVQAIRDRLAAGLPLTAPEHLRALEAAVQAEARTLAGGGR
jgi:hypothetical protein